MNEMFAVAHPILPHEEARAPRPRRPDLFPSLPFPHASDTDTVTITTNRSMFNPINPFIGGAASAAAVVAAQSAWSDTIPSTKKPFAAPTPREFDCQNLTWNPNSRNCVLHPTFLFPLPAPRPLPPSPCRKQREPADPLQTRKTGCSEPTSPYRTRAKTGPADLLSTRGTTGRGARAVSSSWGTRWCLVLDAIKCQSLQNRSTPQFQSTRDPGWDFDSRVDVTFVGFHPPIFLFSLLACFLFHHLDVNPWTVPARSFQSHHQIT
jgi:hypothetical protein